ncbi:MAG: transposase [Candidatus Acidiferrales bacterium]
MDFERKRIRLAAEHYKGRGRYFLTFCCESRRQVFRDPVAAVWLLRRLREIADADLFLLHAWCLMPDHLHILIEGLSEKCAALAFAAKFKQMTGYEGKPMTGANIWQGRFYDHILRTQES